MLFPDPFSRPYIGDFIPDTETQLQRLNRYYRVGRAEPNREITIRYNPPDESIKQLTDAINKLCDAYFNTKPDGCCKSERLPNIFERIDKRIEEITDCCGDTDSDQTDNCDSDFDSVAELLDEYADGDSDWRAKLTKFVQNRDDKERLESIEQRVAGGSGNTGGYN